MTSDLKALARQVLARDFARDRDRDKVSGEAQAAPLMRRHFISPPPEPMGAAPSSSSEATDARRDRNRSGCLAVSAPQEQDTETPAQAWSELGQKCADIIKSEGSVPREWVEGFARLDADRPPGDVPQRHWQQFIADVGYFLESQLCAVAVSLGWGPFDLFGCHRDRPFARIDQAGLLWLLNGNRVVMLTDDAATIQMQTDIFQIYRRKPRAANQALAWTVS